VFLGCRFHADKLCLRVPHCIGYTLFLHSQIGRWLRFMVGGETPNRLGAGTLPGKAPCHCRSSGSPEGETCAAPVTAGRATTGSAMNRGKPPAPFSPSKGCCGALDPPVGGTFNFENLIMPPLTKTCPKMVLSHKGGSLCVKDVFAKKFLVPGEIPMAALVAAHMAAPLSESSARAGGIVVTPHASGSRLAVR
jgi:hypothetical protein